MPTEEQLKCFVIMPFGEKEDTDGKLINFDVIHKFIIEAAIKELEKSNGLKFDCVRCDDIEEAGAIHTDMFKSILEADVAVVDITSNNPNVFYELGVRHAVRECVTVLVGHNLDKMPFNIQGLRAIPYDPARVDSFEATKKLIQNHIVNGLKKRKTDSPIRQLIPELKVRFPMPPLMNGRQYRYAIQEAKGKTFALITGDIKRLMGVADVWVSSENTHMQMARFHDKSISGTVRFLGAKHEKGEVADDLIGKALETALGRDGRTTTVQPGHVVATTSGELWITHKVKRIFHVATVQGSPGGGYTPVANIGACVWNALIKADEENAKPGADRLSSMLFPILGAGTARGDIDASLTKMIDATLDYFEQPTSTVDTAYLLTFTREELTAAKHVADERVGTGRLKHEPKKKNRRRNSS